MTLKDINLLETGSILVSPDPKEDPLYYIDLGNGGACKLSIPDLLIDFIKWNVPTLWFFHDSNSTTMQVSSKREEFEHKEPMGYITRNNLLEIAAHILKTASWSQENVDGKVIQ